MRTREGKLSRQKNSACKGPGERKQGKKSQEVRIAAVNKDTLLCRLGIPSRTTHPEANDYLGTESPQAVFPAPPPHFSCLLFLLTRSPHSWGHPVSLPLHLTLTKTE